MSLPNLAKRSWEIYSEEGFLSLLQSSKSFVRHRVRNPTRYSRRYITLKHNELKYDIKYKFDSPDPDIIYIDPMMIDKDVYHVFKKKCPSKEYQNCTLVLDGKWDKNGRGFFNTGRRKYELLHKSLLQRYEKGRPWENTKIFKFLTTEDVSDSRYSNMQQRFDELDDIYESLKKDGWSETDDDYMFVAISRDGEPLRLKNGNHRLRMSKILGLNEIPVKVGVRHTEWQEKRLKASKISSPKKARSELSRYLDHPDIRPVLNKNVRESL